MKMFHKAFTMLELVIVIVVLGIVAKFGVELLIQAYDYYIMNLAENRFQAQSESAVEQIANRLQYRIPGSEVVRLDGGVPASVAITTDDGSANERVLEWVGYDIDGWRGDGTSVLPTWSGFIDINATMLLAATTLATPSSDVTRIHNVIAALSPKYAAGTWDGTRLGLFFVNDSNFNVATGFGWGGAATINDQAHTVHPVDATTNDTLIASSGNFTGQSIYEYYKLSWTAYALVHNATTGELRLYYDYRPWNGEDYTAGSSAVLMENVDTFRFRTAGDAMKVQVCIRDKHLFKDDTTEGFSICKEKTVF